MGGWRRRYESESREAPASIASKAEPATASRSRKTAQAVTTRSAGLRSRAHTARADSQARRLSPAGFPFRFGGRAELLTLLFMVALFGRGFWRLPRKSGGPPLFAPSLNVQGEDTHNNSGFSVIRRPQSPTASRSRANGGGHNCVPNKDRADFPLVLESYHTIAVVQGGAGSGPRLNPVNIDPKNGAAAQKRSF